MKDIFNKLAEDIRNSTIETCAKVAEIHDRPDQSEDFNAAAREIARRIRLLADAMQGLRA